MTDRDRELRGEQRQLDAAEAALEEVVARLADGPGAGIDSFADEALTDMRQELLRTYTEASGPLYFGRIDSAEETLYVGRHSVRGHGNELLAINWRAPAAEPFYAATPADPRGVARRRRLDIEDGAVLGFVDEDLGGAGGGEHLTEAIVEDVDRQRIGEMRQIVSTITADQYELIAERADGPLVIQGGPGTGKTAVGLHRAAWLLYSDRDLGRAGVLVVGPNDTFVHYIRQVLPSLGEHSVDQRPITRVVSTRPIDRQEDPDVAVLKGDARMAELLRRALWERVAAPAAADPGIVVGRTEVTISAAAIGELQASILASGRPYARCGEAFRGRLAELVADHLHPRAADRIRAEGDLLGTIRKSADFKRLAGKCWPRTSPEALLKRAFGNRSRLAEIAGELLGAADVAVLAAHPPATRRNEMTAADVALYDEARSLVAPEHRTYGHVIVDEAQNLSPMELRMLARRARGRSMTILGDIAQRNTTGIDDWGDFLAGAVGQRVAVRRLTVSYRVPGDILRLAGRIGGGSEVPVGVRTAPWQPFAIAASRPDLGAAVAAVAGRLVAAGHSVGVIAPADHRALIGEGFAAACLDVVDAAEGQLGPGANLLDLQLVKGLEFDAIVVVEPSRLLAERPAGGRGGLYTALTRATRALAIVHAEPLPDQLRDAPELRRATADELDAIWGELRREAAPEAAGRVA